MAPRTPTRPASIVAMSTILEPADSVGVIPVLRPTVPNADVVSNRRASVENLCSSITASRNVAPKTTTRLRANTTTAFLTLSEWMPLLPRCVWSEPMIELQTNAATTANAVSYTHLRAHETRHDLVCRLLL